MTAPPALPLEGWVGAALALLVLAGFAAQAWRDARRAPAVLAVLRAWGPDSAQNLADRLGTPDEVTRVARVLEALVRDGRATRVREVRWLTHDPERFRFAYRGEVTVYRAAAERGEGGTVRRGAYR